MDEQGDNTRLVTYAFVDSANIVYRDTDHDPWKIDLRKLIKYLHERFGASRILFYGGFDKQNGVQVRLYEKMKSWGYEMRLNPVKHFVNERGERYAKADVDSRMTFDMMRYFSDYDRAVVLTGDGDFFWVMEYLLQHKERIWLLSSPGKTAKELKKLVAGDFANLDNLRSQLEFKLQKTRRTLRTTPPQV